jgi:hypothetical protein
MTTHDSSAPWWGKYTLHEGETACWRMGELRLWVQRARHEWHLTSAYQPGAEAVVEVLRPCVAEGPPASAAEHRYGFQHPGDSVRLEPRAPDRPLVWRPAEPLSIGPGEESTLYLRMPLWLAFRVEGRDAVLWESPLRRLSDTWFGAPTQEGGYAYSAESKIFLDAQECPRDALHAITPIAIRNSANALLHLDRLNLPVPYLSLYAAQDGGVWTQKVTLERDEEDEALALLRVGKGAPQEAGEGALLAGPRADAEKNLVFQAFRRLFR